jgi:hypothetical protein
VGGGMVGFGVAVGIGVSVGGATVLVDVSGGAVSGGTVGAAVSVGIGADVAVGRGVGIGGTAPTGRIATEILQSTSVGSAITQPRRPVAGTRTLIQPPDGLRASGASNVPPASEPASTG